MVHGRGVMFEWSSGRATFALAHASGVSSSTFSKPWRYLQSFFVFDVGLVTIDWMELGRHGERELLRGSRFAVFFCLVSCGSRLANFLVPFLAHSVRCLF